jgi:hypothetical protein
MISIILIVILVIRYDFGDAFHKMSTLSLTGAVLTLFFYYVAVFISALKWKVLYPNATLGRIFETILVGHFFSMLLPGQLFGEASKIAYLAGDAKKNDVNSGVARLSASVIVDKITGLIGLLILGTFGTFFSSEPEKVRYIAAPFAAAIIGILFILVCLRFQWCYLAIKGFCDLLKKVPQIKMMAYTLLSIAETWRFYLYSPLKLLSSISWGIIYHCLIVCVHLTLCYYLKIHVSFWDLSWVCALLSIILLLPFSIGGVGLRESGYVGALSILSVMPDSALALSLSIFSLHVIGNFVGGLLVLKSIAFRPHTP